MTSINFGSRVSLREAAQLIAAVGTTNNILLRGPMGTGKSSILKMLPEYLGDEYEYVYFDMTAKSEGDTAIPFPDKEAGVMRFFTNEALKLTTGKRVVILLDELPKAPRSIQQMVLPMFENPKRLADKLLPEGSIIIATARQLVLEHNEVMDVPRRRLTEGADECSQQGVLVELLTLPYDVRYPLQ